MLKRTEDWVELRQDGHVYIVLVQMYWKILVISVISILNRILVLSVCPKNMSGITKEGLIEILNKMLDEKFEEKFKLLESKLNKKLAPIKKSVEEAVQSVQFVSSKYDEIKDHLKLIDAERKTFKTALASLQDSTDSVAKSQNDLEYGRRECIEIRGIPVAQDSTNEDTNTIVKNVGKLMGIDIEEEDISISHRLPQSKKYKGKKIGPPAIIARFVKRDKKNKYYGARAKLQSSSIANMGYTEDNKIFISESLTESNRELFKQCLKAKKDLNYDFVWTRNGKIYMKYNSYSAARLISTKDEVGKLYGDK